MCGNIDFILLSEEFQCLDVGKLNHFHSYRYTDKLLSIYKHKSFLRSEKRHRTIGHLAVILRKKNFAG